jgi:hypothetical protein
MNIANGANTANIAGIGATTAEMVIATDITSADPARG